MLVPTVDFFISVYECDSTTGYHTIDTSLQCWTGLHAFYCALFAIGIAVNITLVIMVSLMYNEPRSFSTDAFARLD